TATRLDPSVNYPTNSGGLVGVGGVGNPSALPTGITVTTVAMLENGYLNIVTPGSYTFTMTNDDGATLLIDGLVAINNDATNSTVAGVALTLSAGLHTIQERWVQNTGGAGNILSYTGPDTNGVATVIPAGALSLAAGTAGTLSVSNNNSL